MVMRSVVPDRGTGSAWQLARRSEIKMPCVILVSPYVDGNVGSVSRCMLNWGLSELRIGRADQIYTTILQYILLEWKPNVYVDADF